MIFGAHVIVHSTDAAADRSFFRDVLGFRRVDAGHDWLIFALPPSEVAVHPGDDDRAALSLSWWTTSTERCRHSARRVSDVRR